MATILVLTQFFPPETNPGARRISAMAEVLSQKNNVIILTPQPGYPTSTLFNSSSVKACDQKFPGRIIRGNKAFLPHHPSLVIRALGEVRMVASLTWKAIFVHVDLVIVSTPSMFLAPFAWLLARLKRANFVYDLRDLTWCYVRETADPNGFNTLLSVILEKLMVSILRRSDLVVCATPGIAENLSTCHGLPADKMITIMNGVSDEILAVSQCFPPGQATIQSPIVSYIGLFGHNHGVETLLDVAKQLPAVTFFLVGDGPDKENIVRRLAEEKIGNLIIHKYVTSLDELAKYYYQSAILIGHVRNNSVMRSTAIPSKLFEYMAFGKPIVYIGEGMAVNFLRNIGCAVTIPPDDPVVIAQTISKLLKDTERMKSMGEKGRDYVDKHYRRNELMLQLGDEIEKRFNLNGKVCD